MPKRMSWLIPRGRCRACGLPAARSCRRPTEEDKAAAAAEAFNPGPDGRGDVDAEGAALSRGQGRHLPGGQPARGEAMPKAAGAKYGNPRKQANSPWTYVASGSKARSSPRTRSRARRRSTSTSTATARPTCARRSARRCAARRSATRSTSSTSTTFTNQIDFAQFGKSFNTYAEQRPCFRSCRARSSTAARQSCSAPMCRLRARTCR